MTAPVLFLHGLGRTSRSLEALRRHVERTGFTTWSLSYPSRRQSLEELAAWVLEQVRARFGDVPIHAVTHSMGGILVRHLGTTLNFDRVVMLAPPNAGSRVAQALQNVGPYGRIMGPAALELADATPWPPIPGTCGVIAGTAGVTMGNPVSWTIAGLKLFAGQGPHDGTVLVDETRDEGMADFAEVRASHTWIARHPQTRQLVLRFLRTGSFQ